jgi:hypothetical protein
MMEASRSFDEVTLAVVWMAATAVGSFMALLVAQILLLTIEEIARLSADEVLLGGTLGLLLGIGQWLALRSRLPRSGRWIVYSFVGGVVVGLAAHQAGNRADSVAAFGAYGIIMGAFQWVVLRGLLRRSALWIPANGIAWAVGSQSIVWIDRIALGTAWPFGELLTVAVMYGLLGAMIGAITGALLAWLIHQAADSSRPLTDQLAA